MNGEESQETEAVSGLKVSKCQGVREQSIKAARK